jgi:hypothetical protein
MDGACMTFDEVAEAVRRAILVADPDHVREVDDAGVSMAQCEAIAVVRASPPSRCCRPRSLPQGCSSLL